MRTLRKSALVSLLALPFGLAFGFAFALVGIQLNSDPMWLDITLALIYAMVLSLIPGLVHMSSFPGFPLTRNLEGFQPLEDRRRGHLRFAAASGLTSVIAVAAAAIEPVPLGARVVLAVLLLGAVSTTIVNAYRDFRSIRPHMKQVARSVESFKANSIIYMGRQDGGSYQIAQWLPQLQASGAKPIIVVRHRDAVSALGSSVPASVPIILCVTNADLDRAVTDSVRTVFYVNSVASNSIMVNYLHLNHVYLGHGDSDKEISALPVHRMYDQIFLAGQAALDRYVKAGINLDQHQGVIVGRPQLRTITRATPEQTQLSPRTVLYAPTWSGYNEASKLSSLRVAAPFISDLLGRGIRVIFRPHPLSREITADMSFIRQIDALLQEAGPQHTKSDEAAGEKLTELYNLSDGMLADISSVVIDYLASEKPMAIIDTRHTISLQDYPSAAAAYLVSNESSPEWQEFLGSDSMSESRKNLAAHYIGCTTNVKFDAAIQPLLEP